MICQRCHADNPAGVKFCKACGEPLAASSAPADDDSDATVILSARCAACGAANKAGARFCAVCGASQDEEEPDDSDRTVIVPRGAGPTPSGAGQGAGVGLGAASGADAFATAPPPRTPAIEEDRTLTSPAPMQSGQPAPSSPAEQPARPPSDEVRARLFPNAGTAPPAAQPQQGPGAGLWFGIGAILLVLIGVLAWWLLSQPSTPAPSAPIVDTPAAPPPVEPALPAIVAEPPPPAAASATVAEPPPIAPPAPPPETKAPEPVEPPPPPVAKPKPAPKPKPPPPAPKPAPPPPAPAPAPAPVVVAPPPPPPPVVAPAPVAPAVPEWLTQLRRDLAACEAKGNFFTKAICAEQAKWKHCEPDDRWGKAPECVKPERRQNTY